MRLMRSHIQSAAVALALFAIHSAAQADSIHLDSQGRGNGPGGEFIWTVVGTQNVYGHAVGTQLTTFCVEDNEFISWGQTYDVIVNTGAVNGGVSGGNNNFDPLDARTAYLFQHFSDGNLSNYAYTGSSNSQNASADALQNAIWFLEGEIGSVSGQAQTWINEAAIATAVGGSWYNQYGANSIGNVRVLNLYAQGHAGDQNYVAQDQLVTLGPVPVPAPGATLLGLLGLGLMVGFRRYCGV